MWKHPAVCWPRGWYRRCYPLHQEADSPGPVHVV
eukprot:CCRYP_020699-RA/>CCRYP_020699-RA protein AED:0.47 eAED:1.00 QI:0/-1/0/1/-1/0/1/0/33